VAGQQHVGSAANGDQHHAGYAYGLVMHVALIADQPADNAGQEKAQEHISGGKIDRNVSHELDLVVPHVQVFWLRNVLLITLAKYKWCQQCV
jgi:hypothetical protein